MLPHARLVGDLACLLLCSVAAATDLRHRKVPDLLSLPALAAGLVLAALGGGHDLAGAVTAVVLAAGLLALFAAAGGVGWGDVKLMAAVAALLGWPLGSWTLVLHALLYTALVGGVLAVLTALRRRRLGAALRSVATIARRRRDGEGDRGSGVTVPYAVAIAAGAAWAILGRYLPEVLLG